MPIFSPLLSRFTMPAPESPQPVPRFVRCPGCDERLGVREQDAGRKARCAKCGLVFVIELAKTQASGGPQAAGAAKPQVAETPRPAIEDEGPQTVTFECSLCATRITARVTNVGKKVECPDCGRKNVIPPPPKPTVVKAPAAFSGEQFEVWGVDEKTWERTATGPTLHPVVCELCQTLMYATDAQIGSALRCPDCRTTTVAKRSTSKPAKGPRVIPAGEEYQLDPVTAPAPRPTPTPVAVAVAEKHAAARALTTDDRGRMVKAPEPSRHARPVRPAVPLVTGVWPMLVTGEVIARWALMSILFGLAAWIIISALITPIQSTASIAEIFILLGGIGVGIMWLTFAGPTFLAIVGESAEGHDRFYDPPSWSPLEWMGECFQVASAIGAAGLVGAGMSWAVMAIAHASGLPMLTEVAAGIASVGPLFLFPLAFLGTMLENSMLAVISPRVWSTLFKCPGPWLLFYFETAVLTGGAAAACAGLRLAGPAGYVVMPMIIMGGAIVYMRLLGRLAWWISEATAVDDDEEFVDESEAAHPHLAAARRAAWEAAREGQAADAK